MHWMGWLELDGHTKRFCLNWCDTVKKTNWAHALVRLLMRWWMMKDDEAKKKKRVRPPFELTRTGYWCVMCVFSFERACKLSADLLFEWGARSPKWSDKFFITGFKCLSLRRYGFAGEILILMNVHVCHEKLRPHIKCFITFNLRGFIETESRKNSDKSSISYFHHKNNQNWLSTGSCCWHMHSLTKKKNGANTWWNDTNVYRKCVTEWSWVGSWCWCLLGSSGRKRDA